MRTETNQYGVLERFYLISNSNLEVLLSNRFDKDFKDRIVEDIIWFLNFNNVAIVSSVSLLSRFISKDSYSVMKCCSRVSVVS